MIVAAGKGGRWLTSTADQVIGQVISHDEVGAAVHGCHYTDVG